MVLSIHADDQVEAGPIGRAHLPGGRREVDASSAALRHRSVIGRITRVPATGSCRIDFEQMVDPPLTNSVNENALGGRTSADVAHADEQDLDRHADILPLDRVQGKPTPKSRALNQEWELASYTFQTGPAAGCSLTTGADWFRPDDYDSSLRVVEHPCHVKRMHTLTANTQYALAA